MSRERWIVLGTIWFLLVGGLLVGRYVTGQSPISTVPSDEQALHVEAFRQWLWGYRSLDLAAQVGLIFVGALGIAAILPNNKEDHDACT